MASRNLFTEEGRTRFRNFGLRLRSYLIVFLILRLLAGAFWFANRVLSVARWNTTRNR
jgi:hypothetical protein